MFNETQFQNKQAQGSHLNRKKKKNPPSASSLAQCAYIHTCAHVPTNLPVKIVLGGSAIEYAGSFTSAFVNSEQRLLMISKKCDKSSCRKISLAFQTNSRETLESGPVLSTMAMHAHIWTLLPHLHVSTKGGGSLESVATKAWGAAVFPLIFLRDVQIFQA